MAIVFNREDNSELLKSIGIPYGSLVASVAGAYSIVTMVQAKYRLKRLIEDGRISGDEAQQAERTMCEAGIAEDKAALYSKCAAAQLPEGFEPSYSFCSCGCGELGVIIDKGGHKLWLVKSKDETFWLMDVLVFRCTIGIKDAVYLTREAAKSNIPIDNEEILQRYDALPENEKQQRRRGAVPNHTFVTMGAQVSVERD